MNVKLDVTLPAETVATIEEQVALGRFASPSDLLQQAVEALVRQGEGFAEADVQFMRERIEQSLANPGPTISPEEMRGRMKEFVSKLYGTD